MSSPAHLSFSTQGILDFGCSSGETPEGGGLRALKVCGSVQAMIAKFDALWSVEILLNEESTQ
jgi:hypothetical protein